MKFKSNKIKDLNKMYKDARASQEIFPAFFTY